MEILLWCIGAHFIGDIALQSSWQADNKGALWYVMLSHCAIWTTCICVPLRVFGQVSWWVPCFLLAGHYAIDWYKTRFPKTPDQWWRIYPDQLAHGLQILIVVLMGRPR